ncbi:MAG: dihydropteroate synthase [Alphaproteobacteria bacterium HGW-Alphaproteobacteria-6]|nr:MAG: dihydropteroate synthase [Alphaproteobacteria bacterium HGW-Alphaproteobacteria-6]
MDYFRPIAMTDAARPAGALALVGGWCWFERVEHLTRAGSRGIVAAADLPDPLRRRLVAPRPALFGIDPARPRLMGIVNVTPDSFSDGGAFADPGRAVAQGLALAAAGADLIDIGGESTRPGSAEVPATEEIARVVPVIAGLRRAGLSLPVSIDTRKAVVARAALAAGADIVNDVAALRHDPEMVSEVVAGGAGLCLMHAQGDPATMQKDPHYPNVLLDVFDFLAGRIAAAEAAGIPRERIAIDPGIGFGKTLAHNLALIRGLSLLHGLGCAILLGASRKRFIGTIGGGAALASADRRGPGTVAVTLAGIAQGVQIHRVHDIEETRQAVLLWQALHIGENP